MGPLEVLTQLEFIGVCRIWSTWACFDHISLIQTQNHAPFFLLDSLLIEEFYNKILEFFINQIDRLELARPYQPISIEVHYSSRFKFGAPKIVLVISHSSRLKIMRCFFFFFWIPYSSRNIMSNFQIFSQSAQLVGNWFSRIIVPSCMKH